MVYQILNRFCARSLGPVFLLAMSVPTWIYGQTPADADEQEQVFQRAVEQYGGRPKPGLPEEVRRLKVQAEVAIKERLFEDAVRLYAAALKAAPWWSEGHYNSAILLGELGQYDDAMRAMQRFLRLEPNTATARTAQDRIYQWEYQKKRDGVELASWALAKDSKTEGDLKAFLDKYPNGRFADAARSRLSEIQRAATAERIVVAPKPAPPENKAMALLPGLWQSQIADNQFQMAVDWNEVNKQFEGKLAAQGTVSRNVGFTVGEIIWVARPTANPNVLTESQMYRWGGLFSGYRWEQGTINLDQSSHTDLVTSFVRFRRVQ